MMNRIMNIMNSETIPALDKVIYALIPLAVAKAIVNMVFWAISIL